MEVLTRFELVNKGFADLRLTAWPQHHVEKRLLVEVTGLEPVTLCL